MTESHDLDIDKKSYPRLQTLTNRWLGTHSRVVDLHAAPGVEKKHSVIES
jgi:hypothetical protein